MAAWQSHDDHVASGGQKRSLWVVWSNLCGLAVTGALVILTFDLPAKETGIIAIVAMFPVLLLQWWREKLGWLMAPVGAAFLGSLLVRSMRGF